MKVRIEAGNKAKGVVWLVVDEKTESIPIYNKAGKVIRKDTETTQRCNIAIIDYAKREDADRVAEAIAETLRKL